jgi:hypothetical protein
MVDPFWLECDTCRHCRREGERRLCRAQGTLLDRPPVVECPLHHEQEGLAPEVKAMLARRYCGLY